MGGRAAAQRGDDGAQATDVGCLVRRLGARLEAPEGWICGVGTSATMGGGSEASRRELRAFAEDVFGGAFPEGSIVTSERLDTLEVDGGSSGALSAPPPWERDDWRPEMLVPENHETLADYIRAQAELWFGVDGADPLELGELLARSATVEQIAEVASGGPVGIEEICGVLRQRRDALATRQGKDALPTGLGNEPGRDALATRQGKDALPTGLGNEPGRDALPTEPETEPGRDARLTRQGKDALPTEAGTEPGEDALPTEGGVPLDALGEAVWERWREEFDSAAELAAALMPPDLEWLESWQEFVDELAEAPEEETPEPPAGLVEALRARASWETTMEYGLRSRVGRTLELTGCSTAAPAFGLLEEVAEGLRVELVEEEPVPRGAAPGGRGGAGVRGRPAGAAEDPGWGPSPVPRGVREVRRRALHAEPIQTAVVVAVRAELGAAAVPRRTPRSADLRRVLEQPRQSHLVPGLGGAKHAARPGSEGDQRRVPGGDTSPERGRGADVTQGRTRGRESAGLGAGAVGVTGTPGDRDAYLRVVQSAGGGAAGVPGGLGGVEVPAVPV